MYGLHLALAPHVALFMIRGGVLHEVKIGLLFRKTVDARRGFCTRFRKRISERAGSHENSVDATRNRGISKTSSCPLEGFEDVHMQSMWRRAFECDRPHENQ